jgi:hypothetical protein
VVRLVQDRWPPGGGQARRHRPARLGPRGRARPGGEAGLGPVLRHRHEPAGVHGARRRAEGGAERDRVRAPHRLRLVRHVAGGPSAEGLSEVEGWASARGRLPGAR